MKRYGYLIAGLLLWGCVSGFAQAPATSDIRLIVPDGYVRGVLDGKDTIPLVRLPHVYVFPELKFRNEKERQKYNKLVRDVKRTLPYAKLIYETLIETYEYIETRALGRSSRHVRRNKGDLHSRPRRGAGRGEPRQRGPRRADVVHKPDSQSAYVGSDDEVLRTQFPPFRPTQPRACGDVAQPPREAADRNPPCAAQPQSNRLGLVVAPRAF